MDSTRRLTRFVLGLFAAGLVACAGRGTESRPTDQGYLKGTEVRIGDGVRSGRIRVGVSAAEVVAAYGEPAGRSVRADGAEDWRYDRLAFLPGSTVTYVASTDRLFVRDGRVVDWRLAP